LDVEEFSPMKRGLKDNLEQLRIGLYKVEEFSPMKRGLKALTK